MGLYMYRFRKGKIAEASIIGVVGLLFRSLSRWPHRRFLTCSRVHSFAKLVNSCDGRLRALIASVLPVWMLLLPRDYLSSYPENRHHRCPDRRGDPGPSNLKHAGTDTFYTRWRNQFIPGKLYPFVFITIACGAPSSGFHALISSGNHAEDDLKRE